MTREQWLEQAVTCLSGLFEDAGATLPDKLRVTCGWPHTRATGSKGRRIGECWSPEASQDETTEIFISPVLDDSAEVLSTLAHELVHAAVGTEHGHRKPFKQLGAAIGLEGKAASMSAGDGLKATFETWLPKLGKYPHAMLDKTKSGQKKQTTRLLKSECEPCGYTVRITRKWLEELGAPICPSCHEQMSNPLHEEE